jgi:hypothetical protein
LIPGEPSNAKFIEKQKTGRALSSANSCKFHGVPVRDKNPILFPSPDYGSRYLWRRSMSTVGRDAGRNKVIATMVYRYETAIREILYKLWDTRRYGDRIVVVATEQHESSLLYRGRHYVKSFQNDKIWM